MKGNIYYDTNNNIYHVITTDVLLENKVSCMLFEGFKTEHKYITSMVVDANHYEMYDDRFVQVGGIY